MLLYTKWSCSDQYMIRDVHNYLMVHCRPLEISMDHKNNNLLIATSYSNNSNRLYHITKCLFLERITNSIKDVHTFSWKKYTTSCIKREWCVKRNSTASKRRPIGCWLNSLFVLLKCCMNWNEMHQSKWKGEAEGRKVLMYFSGWLSVN